MPNIHPCWKLLYCYKRDAPQICDYGEEIDVLSYIITEGRKRIGEKCVLDPAEVKCEERLDSSIKLHKYYTEWKRNQRNEKRKILKNS